MNGFFIIYPFTALLNITFALSTDPRVESVFVLLTGINFLSCMKSFLIYGLSCQGL